MQSQSADHASRGDRLYLLAGISRGSGGVGAVGRTHGFRRRWPHDAELPNVPTRCSRGQGVRSPQNLRTFSDCTTAPRNGLPSGCYPLDDFYRALPESKRLRVIRQQQGRASRQQTTKGNRIEAATGKVGSAGERVRAVFRIRCEADPAGSGRLGRLRARAAVAPDHRAVAPYGARVFAECHDPWWGHCRVVPLRRGEVWLSIVVGRTRGHLPGRDHAQCTVLQTLTTGQRPLSAMSTYAGKPFAIGWAVGALLSSVIWHFPQYALAGAVLVDMADLLGWAAPETSDRLEQRAFFFAMLVLIWSIALTFLYGRSIKTVRRYETIVKVMVWGVVLCFAWVVFNTGVRWGDFGRGLIPFRVPPDRDGFAAVTFILSGLSAAVGVNMLFLYPYSQLARGWTRSHRRLARFDLLVGMVLPYSLATALMIVATANTLYQGEAKIDDSLRPVDAARALAEVVGPTAGRIVLNLGVLGMALSSITLHMLTAGFVACELFGVRAGTLKYQLATLIPIPGVLGPLLWGKVAVWVSIPTNIICGFLLPLAYWGIWRLQRSEQYLGSERPTGWRGRTWSSAMLAVALSLSLFYLWYLVTKVPSLWDSWFGAPT